MNVKQACWLYLIKKGMVAESFSYYGVSRDYEKTLEIREYIELDGLSAIDWSKTKEVEDGYSEEFAGTFVDPDQIKYMKGDLVLISGEVYTFYLEIDSDWSFKDTVEVVLELIEEKSL